MIAAGKQGPRGCRGPGWSGRPSRCGLAVLALLCATGAVHAVPAESGADAGEVLALNSDLQVRVRGGREILLEVRVGPDGDVAAAAHRIALDSKAGGEIARQNGGTTGARWARAPLALLNAEHRALVLQSLFPDDHRDGADWIHVAQAGRLATYDEGLWQVAEWFTGDGAGFTALMQTNALSTPELRSGQRVRIAAAQLHAAFRIGATSDDGSLEFAQDTEGAYAGYRLRAGEALYSAVVVRFTGRTASADVTEVAEQVRARNHIPDLRDIPAGYRIKIPIDLVEPEWLPRDHPRRVEAEARRKELALELAKAPRSTRRGLEGVLVILDAGHGGRDLGTMNNGIWEHDYVYDVTCRLKQKLEETTAAKVSLTLEDRETGCVPSAGDALKANQQGTVLTNPPFLAREQGEATIGVNLRWYLANSIYRKALAEGYAAERVIFMSLHADARHAALAGVMVYVPGAEYVSRTYGKSSSPYDRYSEVREQPLVSFSKQQRVRSEAFSRRYADAVVAGFGAEGLPVQPYQPVRDRIIRGKQRFVPAVLRGNQVPTKVLVEMVNLSNRDDAALLARAKDRERLANALLRSLFTQFGAPENAPRRDIAAAGP